MAMNDFDLHQKSFIAYFLGGFYLNLFQFINK